jgi:ABC-type cobalamin/Fe3+-siderophores transport system ATPase subunit
MLDGFFSSPVSHYRRKIRLRLGARNMTDGLSRRIGTIAVAALLLAMTIVLTGASANARDGERQLALIARALAQGARLLVLDEPATGLDYGHQVRLLQKLTQLRGEGFGILMTTHHPDHAVSVSTRIIALKHGRVMRNRPPRDVVTSDTIFELYGVHVADAQNFSSS